MAPSSKQSVFLTPTGGPAVCALIFLLAPFLYSFGFCFPAGDDFDEATRAMFLFDLPGGIYEAAREWLTWSGRYSYHFLAVFLGKAAEHRFSAGILCFACLLAYGLAATLLCRALHRPKYFSLFFGALFLLALCVCHQFLPVFYLQTDALTCGLQGAIWMFFLVFVIRLRIGLANNFPTNKTQWKRCLVVGIIAIGLYEHAALAVFFTVLGALVYTFPWGLQGKNPRAFCAEAIKKPFPRLAIWLSFCLVLSFLAPGNFARKIARGATSTPGIELVYRASSDWFAAIADFAVSPWPFFVILLAIFWRSSGNFLEKPLIRPLAFITITVLGFCGFSLCLALLHAASDVPFSSAVKLRASLGFYAACALGLVCNALFQAMTLKVGAQTKRCLQAAALAGCFVLAFLSPNFQQTAINAANGQMNLYGDFMAARYAFLMTAGKDANWRRFGLIGEIARGGQRKTPPASDWRDVVVPQAAFPPFPLAYEDTLKKSPEQWPNNWVAWLYGLRGVEAREPEAASAIHAVETGNASELIVPKELLTVGINAAWRLRLPFASNPAFSVDWLVLDTAHIFDARMTVLRPNPPSPWRLAPAWLQKIWLENLIAKSEVKLSEMYRLAGTEMTFTASHWQNGQFYALPLAVERSDATVKWPPALFVGQNGSLYRLTPYLF